MTEQGGSVPARTTTRRGSDGARLGDPSGSDWRRRRLAGGAGAVVGPALVTAAFGLSRDPAQFRPGVWYLLVVVAAAFVGGVTALGVSTPISAIGLWYTVSTPPHSFGALDAAEWWGIVGFVLVAGAIGLLVTRLEAALRERDTAVGARARAEAETAAQRELVATRAELHLSELRRLRVRHNVDSLQEAMLPHELPVVTGFELDTCYTPASPDLAIGGDWYDAFAVNADTLAFAVGDVSGHGVDAAALMAQLRNALRAYALEDERPGDVLGRLNRFLCRLDTEQFATVVYGTVALGEARCTWSVAGHPTLLFFGPRGATVGDDTERRGPLLGFRPDASFGESTEVLEPGEGLLAYSDGLVERRGEHIDDGTERLRRIVDELWDEPIDHLCDQFLKRIAGGHEGRDDVCQLLVRRVAS